MMMTIPCRCLLLQVRIDGSDPDGAAFNAIVGVLALLVPLLPVATKLIVAFEEKAEDKASDKIVETS